MEKETMHIVNSAAAGAAFGVTFEHTGSITLSSAAYGAVEGGTESLSDFVLKANRGELEENFKITDAISTVGQETLVGGIKGLIGGALFKGSMMAFGLTPLPNSVQVALSGGSTASLETLGAIILNNLDPQKEKINTEDALSMMFDSFVEGSLLTAVLMKIGDMALKTPQAQKLIAEKQQTSVTKVVEEANAKIEADTCPLSRAP